MNTDQRIVFIRSQTVCAMAEIEGMKADNIDRQSRGESLAYYGDDFNRIPGTYGLEHDQVIAYLMGK